MHLDATWMIPLAVGAGGAVALSVVAALLRREVSELQKSMRPLRLPAGRPSQADRPLRP